MNEKKYTVLDRVLQDVTKKSIRLSDEDKIRYNEHLGKVRDCILEQMKKDEEFKFLYRSNVYTGSYYENLRISKPDEFDINLVFMMPATYKVIYNGKQPGFVKVKVISLDESLIKKQVNTPNLEKILKSWIDQSGYLLRTNFMQWMQGVFTKALDEVSLHNTQIKRSASGPAFTIKVSQPNIGLSEYSVDLVPVFEFPEQDLPSPPIRKLPKEAKHKEWTIVPKAAPDMTDPTYWRMSFYKQEREVMNNLYGMKHIIKLMKLFRDHHNWKVLSSYAIKTTFLWEYERQQTRQKNEEVWKNSVGILFIYMLRRLSVHFENKSIPFYWDKNLNLLSKVKEDTLKNMNNRISLILKQVDMNLANDPQLIKKYFGCTNEPQGIKNCQSFTNNNVHEESLLDLDFELCTLVENNLILPASTNKNQNKSPFIEYTEGTKSQVTVTSNIDGPCKCNIQPEEKINRDVQCRFGCNNAHSLNINNSGKTPELSMELSLILKEQCMIKQHLQSLSELCTGIMKEIKELRQENAYLWKHMRNNQQEVSIPSQSSTVIPCPSDFQPTIDQCNFLNHHANTQKHSTVTSAQTNEASMILSNASNDQFSELLGDFLNSK